MGQLQELLRKLPSLEAVLADPAFRPAVEDLGRDPDRRAVVAAAGRRRVLEEFGLDRMVGETESFFRSLLDGRPGQ